MKCLNCGRDIPNDSIYCEFCGVQVKFSDALQKKSKRTLWIILSVVLAVVIAVVAFTIIKKEQEHQAAQKQQELEQQLEAEHQARLEAERKAELARQEAARKAEQARQEQKCYIDLGLPSGTLWKNTNEGGDGAYYTYDEAVKNFGSKMATEAQWEELTDYCTWSWTGDGYKVIGPNGNSITLPAAGYRNWADEVYDVGASGSYWSSTLYDPEFAWYLYFNSIDVGLGYYYRFNGQSVRLVQ